MVEEVWHVEVVALEAGVQVLVLSSVVAQDKRHMGAELVHASVVAPWDLVFDTEPPHYRRLVAPLC